MKKTSATSQSGFFSYWLLIAMLLCAGLGCLVIAETSAGKAGKAASLHSEAPAKVSQRALSFAERVPHFIKLVGLAGFEHAYPYQMSGGMQQRCGLARALAIEPDVLLMDEPFAAVDAQTREILQFELLRIWETRPTSMIFVTHSIEEAVLMGDRVFVLKGRPSNIQKIVEVDLPHPRTRETLKQARFAELRELVWNTLMKEAREAEFHLAR